jgi:hypothetical protein
MLQGEREENVGIAERVVIEKIVGAGAEVAHVKSPSSEGNGQAELALLVALPVQRQETLIGI